jgi:hypothetical protein
MDKGAGGCYLQQRAMACMKEQQQQQQQQQHAMLGVLCRQRDVDLDTAKPASLPGSP